MQPVSAANVPRLPYAYVLPQGSVSATGYVAEDAIKHQGVGLQLQPNP